ncbi:hypothetical protein QBC36DRAFT_200885, partial [Triangularia setosa]
METPQLSSRLIFIENWHFPGPVLVGGDFNAYHPLWQPGRECPAGRRIAGWLGGRLTLASRPGPTNIYGNTIDLVMASDPGTQAWVDEEAYTGSDHYTITGTTPTADKGGGRAGRPYIPNEEEDRALFRSLVRWGIESVPKEAATNEELDRWAQALRDVLVRAIEGAGRKRRQAGTRAPWWNEECREAHAALKLSRRTSGQEDEDRRETGRAFEAAIRRAKKAYWEQKLEQATSNKAIYAVTAWHKATDTFAPPPLSYQGQTYTAPGEKLELMRREVVERFGDGGDVEDPWGPLQGVGSVSRSPPPAVTVGDRQVEPKREVRWLGFFLDPKLNFKTHADRWATKAMRVAGHLRGLNKVIRGTPPRATAEAVRAVVVPTATYGAAT